MDNFSQTWMTLTDQEKCAFLDEFVPILTSNQQMYLDRLLQDRLKCDFIIELPTEISDRILICLDIEDLCRCELVNTQWRAVIKGSTAWRRKFQLEYERNAAWRQYVEFCGFDLQRPLPISWKAAFRQVIITKADINKNWKQGRCSHSKIRCHSDGVYCLQYDNEKIVAGGRDDNIKIYDMQSKNLVKTIQGHTGSVLCLQYDEHKIVSGSSDGTIRIWDFEGRCRNILRRHSQSVLHLRILGNLLVTSSKDHTAVLWKDFKENGDYDYEVVHHLQGHRAAVNVVEFDENRIVSASGDRTIRVWSTESGVELEELRGHDRGIACLHYHGNTIVTGSSDKTVRVWNLTPPASQVATLLGHEDLVRCVRFNQDYIVSGSYDNTIIVWDFKTKSLLTKLRSHESRVFRVQFDALKMISSSQDDSLIIWDFTQGVHPPPKRIESEV